MSASRGQRQEGESERTMWWHLRGDGDAMEGKKNNGSEIRICCIRYHSMAFVASLIVEMETPSFKMRMDTTISGKILSVRTRRY